MTQPDPHHHEPVSDATAEQLISGRSTPDGTEGVAAALADLRRLSHDTPPPSPMVLEYLRTAPAPTSPPTADDIPPMPAPLEPHRRRRPLARVLVAAAASLGVVGVAQATGAIDVLPGDDEPELVATDNPVLAPLGAVDDRDVEPDEEPEAPEGVVDERDVEPEPRDDPEAEREANASVEISASGDGTVEARIGFGDVAAAIVIESRDGAYSVAIDVEGVSEACETALEALENVTDQSGFEAAVPAIETACEGEVGLPDIASREDLAALLRDFELEINLPENLADIEGFLEDFGSGRLDVDEFGALFDGDLDQYLERFESFFQGVDPGTFGNVGPPSFLEGVDPQTFFEDFDLETFLEEFDPQTFFEDLEVPDELRGDIEELRGQVEQFLEDMGAGGIVPEGLWPEGD